jgi:hypothetical protein
MIVLNLQCDQGHRFDGWFASRDAFGDQCERGLVQCTFCQSVMVNALPSSPHVRRSGAATEVVPSAQTGQAEVVSPDQATAQKVFQALAAIARQAENVGTRFPEEARRIHHEEAPQRSIRGIASREETRELLEEGILVLPAPVPPENETH